LDELILVRHGYAHCNRQGIIAGPERAGLTEHGRAQADALGGRLAIEGGVTAIHSSTTRRAVQTASILADTLGLPVQARPDLRVPDPGAAEGLPWALARARWATDPANPIRPYPPDAEPWPEYLTRAGRELTDIIDNHPGGRVVVIGHAETVTAAYCVLLGVSDLGRLKLATDHGARCIWRPVQEWDGVAVPARRWALVSHNDVSHLPPALVTHPIASSDP